MSEEERKENLKKVLKNSQEELSDFVKSSSDVIASTKIPRSVNANISSEVDVKVKAIADVKVEDKVKTTTTTTTDTSSRLTETVSSTHGVGVASSVGTSSVGGSSQVPVSGSRDTSSSAPAETNRPYQSEKGRVNQPESENGGAQNVSSDQQVPSQDYTSDNVDDNQNYQQPEETSDSSHDYGDDEKSEPVPEDYQSPAETENQDATGEKNGFEEGEGKHGEEETPTEGGNPQNPVQGEDYQENNAQKPENQDSESDDFNDAVNRNNHNQRLNNNGNNTNDNEPSNNYRKNSNFDKRKNNAVTSAEEAKDTVDGAKKAAEDLKKGSDAAKSAEAAKKGADAVKKAEAAKTAEAAGAAKAGEKGIIAFFKTYPWVLLIIIVVIILILIILTVIITFELDKELKEGSNSNSSGTNSNRSYSEIVDANGICMPFSVENTKLSKSEFKQKLVEYSQNNQSTYFQVFVDNADTIYDISKNNDTNPELVVIRAIAEGYSPVSQGYASYNNYWGLECYNGKPLSTCKSFSTFDEGVLDFVSKIKRYSEGEDSIFKVMSHYVSLGPYWYNPGNSGLGGCYYKDYVAKYLPDNLKQDVYNACGGKTCTGADCVPTTEEQQNAYYNYQVDMVMSPKRLAVFGLENDTCKPTANMSEVQLGSAIVKYSIARFDDFGYSQPNRHSDNYVDCSSLVNRTFNELFGVNIYENVPGYPTGDVTGPEYNWCQVHGKMISEDELIPGDIIFWTGDKNHYGNIGHVAFYVGEENGVRLQFAAHTSNTAHDDQVSVSEYRNNGSYFCRPTKGENWTSEKL